MMPETNPPAPPASPARPGTPPLRDQVEAVMNNHVTPALGEVVGQAEATLQDASMELRAQAERLAVAVRGQPLTSIGLAALGGFVLARLSGR
ncbi:MAG: hypothetical protein K5Q68_13395 [Roseococcus sp.]|nr:hypothetical protein [Roseococcus sp.]